MPSSTADGNEVETSKAVRGCYEWFVVHASRKRPRAGAALVVAIAMVPHAHAEDADDDAHTRVGSSGSTDTLRDLSLQAFAVRDGWFGEIGLCTARRPGTISTYACLSLDLGRQADAVVAAEAGEWGLRVEPTERVSLQAGVGFSLLTLVVDMLECAARKSGGAGADGPAEMASSNYCGEVWLPMQFYPGLRGRLVVPARIADIVLTGSVRYIVPILGSVSVQPPSGIAVAVGAGIAF
jgi:hypothetical protein